MNIMNNTVKNTFHNLPEQKRDMIVQAAVKEFASKGYQKASVNAIARELGIAKGSLYQYFANKEALFLHVFETFTTLVRESVKKRVSSAGGRDFFILTRKVLMAGIDFIDRHPEYFQLYLRVLFELDVPRREELVAKVRLFSGEYFGPICEQAQKGGQIRKDIQPQMVIFILDAMMDRFLQAYAEPYLDGGLGLSVKSGRELADAVDSVMQVLQDGLSV